MHMVLGICMISLWLCMAYLHKKCCRCELYGSLKNTYRPKWESSCTFPFALVVVFSSQTSCSTWGWFVLSFKKCKWSRKVRWKLLKSVATLLAHDKICFVLTSLKTVGHHTTIIIKKGLYTGSSQRFHFRLDTLLVSFYFCNRKEQKRLIVT